MITGKNDCNDNKFLQKFMKTQIFRVFADEFYKK